MAVDASEFVFIVLLWAIVLAVLVGALTACYWVIRKAVAAGIRDAREARGVHKDR